MRSTVLFVFFTLLTHALFAQIKLDVAGDARILGRLQLQQSVNDNSVFVGTGTGINDDGTTNNNTAFGIEALHLNTTGRSNVAIGYFAERNNPNALFSTAVGAFALEDLANGHSNTGLGYASLQSLLEGDHNIAVGFGAMQGATLIFNPHVSLSKNGF